MAWRGNPGPAGPPVSDAARAAGLVDVRTVVPDAVIDLRYATPNNFVGVPMYPAGARCLVDEAMAAGLAAAADALRPGGDVLVFWDCYRPHDVQVRMYRGGVGLRLGLPAGPYARSHEAGLSVDVTLRAAAPRRHGNRFRRVHAARQRVRDRGVSPAAQANRARLRDAMAAGGLTVYKGEWWHSTPPGAYTKPPDSRCAGELGDLIPAQIDRSGVTTSKSSRIEPAGRLRGCLIVIIGRQKAQSCGPSVG